MLLKRCKKWIATLLILASMVALLPALPAAAAQPTEQEFANKIAQLKQEYPAYKYWSNANGKVAEGRYKGTSLVGPNGCYDNFSKCGVFAVNGQQKAWQCRGYVVLLADKVFGNCYYNDNGEWSYKSYSKGSYGGAYYAGDLIKLKMNSGREHWIFITRVTSDKLYYTDCNRVGKCQIDWKYESVSAIRGKTIGVEHYAGNTLKGTATAGNHLTVTYNANGGKVEGSEVTQKKYQVVVDVGVNLRSDATTSGSKVANLPQNAVFTVTATKTAEGYTWGKTTYNGKTGWCVISNEKWTKNIGVPVTEYYTSAAGELYQSSTLSIVKQTMSQGVNYPDGLKNAEEFGLVKEGFRFYGWSTKKEGGTVWDPNVAVKPEQIVSSIKDGDKTVVLYAVWREDDGVPFYDAWPEDWFYAGVKFAYERGWMSGISAHYFDPNGATTRAMVVAILYRLEGSPAVSGDLKFTDVPAKSWYTDAVKWASEQEIVSGVGGGKFAPDKSITRAEMASILLRYAKVKELDRGERSGFEGFADASKVAEWAKEGLQWAVAEGVISGVKNGNKLELQPVGGATRAQIASVLSRFVQNVVEFSEQPEAPEASEENKGE